MRIRSSVVGLTVVLVAVLALQGIASNAEMFFSFDKRGAVRAASIQEGDSIWICVFDPDENTDCDVRDKIWTDIKVMDPKTGAYITWISYRYDDPVAGAAAVGDLVFDQYYDSALYIPFQGHFPGNPGSTLYDYLEETGPDTGLFVSARAFQVGTREDVRQPVLNTHVVDSTPHPNPNGFTCGVPLITALGIWLHDFQWGGYEHGPLPGLPGGIRDYYDGFPRPSGNAVMPWPNLLNPVLPAARTNVAARPDYLVGRFENNDTLVGMYVDPDDPADVAIAMTKIKDTEATISWNEEIYKDAHGSATITIVDPDENLDCSVVEWVPVFVIVNPGSWNPVDSGGDQGAGALSPTNFCMLKATGGIIPLGDVENFPAILPALNVPISWWNIYNSNLVAPTRGVGLDFSPANTQDLEAGSYYIQYPSVAVVGLNPNVVTFDTSDRNGKCRVSFWAQETGASTGIFELDLEDLAGKLGFNSLNVRDVLVAYYLDPNDEDDFKLAAAYIEERRHSVTGFAEATRTPQDLFWLGRDAVYLEVADANANVDPCCPEQVVVHICDPHEEDDDEYVVLDEISGSSPIFFTHAGIRLRSSWDALGIGWWGWGFQIVADNWRIEAYNEDSIYARYNDVFYYEVESVPWAADGLAFLGDIDIATAFPPQIRAIRVANDVSFDVMEIVSTEVYDGSGEPRMWFLGRQGNRVSGYVSSDCVFVEVLDPDQDEDQRRRERIDAYWDGGNLLGAAVGPTAGQNFPFGPASDTPAAAPLPGGRVHPVLPGAVPPNSLVNNLLGTVNPWDPSAVLPPAAAGFAATDRNPHLYVLNPRTGFWTAIDLLETGVASGDFVSTICVDLASQYVDAPTLGALPGDTILAVYQDPSNHSDSAWISIKVGIGGGGTPPSQASTTMFVDAAGVEVANYMDADMAYVKVIDPSHAGAATLENAVVIDGEAFSLAHLAGAANDTFITADLNLDLTVGQAIKATYTDPTDPTDTSSDTITVIASELAVVGFYATPNPFVTDVEFTFDGTGIATVMSVEVYDLSGKLVWYEELAKVTGIVWNGADMAGVSLANGGYIYTIVATDGTNAFYGKGLVFVRR